jgi:hypothetical protein
MVQSYSGNLSVFSIDGNSVLEYIENASLRISPTHEESASAARFGSNMRENKRAATVDATILSDVSSGVRLNHLGLTAAKFGSFDLLSPNILRSLTLNLNFVHKMKAGVGELWAYPIVADGSISASAELDIDDSALPDWIKSYYSATQTDRHIDLEFALGGITYKLPMAMGEKVMEIGKGELMTATLSLLDRSGRSGATVLPSGTTTLFHKALNAPKEELEFAFSPLTDKTFDFTGNIVFASASLEITESLIRQRYSFALQGEPTVTEVDSEA